MDVANKQTGNPSLSDLEAKIDALTAQVAMMAEQQRAISELMAESGPILTAVMQTATGKLAELEERGWFDFGKAGLRLLDRVVEGYTAEDVDRLGDSVVGILDTVRNVTQPDVLQVANEATGVLHNADTIEPVGLMGAVKRSRDEDVQRGLAVMLEMLSHVGKAAGKARAGDPRQRKLAKHLAPSRPGARIGTAAPAPARRQPIPMQPQKVQAAHCKPAPPPVAAAPGEGAIRVAGVAFDAEGFLVDNSVWTEELAKEIAGQLGIGELSEAHWAVIQYARATWEQTGTSANVRQLGKGSGVATKDIYALFKKAPGKSAAKVAGVPKPAGCI